jgi:hypothetical protein
MDMTRINACKGLIWGPRTGRTRTPFLEKKTEGTEHGNVVQNMGIPKFQGILGWTLA